jgi:ubiquinone/menaquinone biosynthesis C-methylase UbiE
VKSTSDEKSSILNPWWRLVRFGFRLLYNEMAFTYDTVSKLVSMGAWRCWQRSALKHLHVSPEARILELAHGTGDLQHDLFAAGYYPIGYDLSPYMGRITQRKLKRQGISPRLIRGKVQQLPFKDAVFDAILCTFPTDFIVERQTLSEVRRILRPGGTFVVVINGAFTGKGVVISLLEWLYRITGQRRRQDANPATGQSLTKMVYERFLQNFTQNGFDAQLVEEPCPRSSAQLVVARRI